VRRAVVVFAFAALAVLNDSASGANQWNPVNLGSGVAMYDVRLLSISQAPLSLDFVLSYHSQDPNRPTLIYLPLDLGWTHSFNETLVPTDGTNALLYRITREGWEEEYTADGTNHWSASSPAEVRGTVALASNEYTLTDMNGTKTVFDALATSATFGRWKRTVDRWGNTIAGTYSGADLVTITDSVNRAITLSYTFGKLTQVVLPGGDTWRFQYTNGRLGAIFDPLHTGTTAWKTFAYVNNAASVLRFLTAATDDANKVLQAFSYDPTDRAFSASSEGGTDSMTIQYGTPTSSQTRVTRAQTGSVSLVTDYTLIYQGTRWLTTKAEGGCSSCGVSGADTVTYQYFPTNYLQNRVEGLDLTGSGGTDERVETDYTYDANGMMLTRVEAVGKAETRTTTFAYGQTGPLPPAWPAFATQISEVSVNPSQSKTTTNTWNNAENQLTTTTVGYLSPTGVQATYQTITSYDPSHHPTSVSGPRTNQLTSLAYYSNADVTTNRRGRLQSQTVTVSAAPSSLTTTFDNYDLYGTARSMVDPNAVETQRTTDGRGRVLTVVEKKPSGDANEPPDYTTTYTFDTRDRLTQVQRPAGNLTRYRYEDGTNRLLDTIRADSSGIERERLHLTLNLLGGKVQEDAQTCATPANPCTAWSAASRTEAFAYDGKNRLTTITHADSSFIAYTYDSRGNLSKVQDERHPSPNTLNTYDALNRLKQVTQTLGTDTAVTQYAYDRRDNLTNVTDPNTNQTIYTFDDWSRMATQASPVSGTTSYAYDEAGNLTSSTDANGSTTTRTYDLMNRLLSATSTNPSLETEVVSYTYDSAVTGSYGKGRTAAMTDPTGSTTYVYERRGLDRSEVRVISGLTNTLGFGYDANGNRSRITYPTGRVVNYTFDFADRPLTAAASAPVSQNYVTAATYRPFGPVNTITFGNNTKQTYSVDTRYLPSENRFDVVSPPSTIADYTYSRDNAGNITGITDTTSAAYSRTFGYDDLNRITTANSGTALWGTAAGNGYTWDKMGNMLSLQLGASRSETLSYVGTTPLLSSVDDGGLASITYDAAGNEVTFPSSGDLSTSPYTRVYSPRNLFSGASTTTTIFPWIQRTSGIAFGYDGRGIRVTTSFFDSEMPVPSLPYELRFYSPELRLLNWTVNPSGTPVPENDIVWFGERPVAQDSASTPSATHWTFADHLGTPLLQTDALASVVWRVEHEPFGNVFQVRTDTINGNQPLRLPGQEVAWGDSLEEESYNIFRWYRSGIGRYTQADPLGLQGGTPYPLNAMYAYSSLNPLRFVDPKGLAVKTQGCTPQQDAAMQNAAGQAEAAVKTCLPCNLSPSTWIQKIRNVRYNCVDLTTQGVVSKAPENYCSWAGDERGAQTGADISFFEKAFNDQRQTGCGCLQAQILHELAHVLGCGGSEPCARTIAKKCFSCANN
jgi:RHS repeat-associated protein